MRNIFTDERKTMEKKIMSISSSSRRSFLKAIGSGAAVFVLGDITRAARGAARPNILWLSCEDISPHLGCFGDEFAITPNIDNLAGDGIRYTNAFTTAGVCAPVRSGIITGMYHTTIGTHHMRCSAKLPGFIKAFTSYLRDVGYYCTNNSKTDYQTKDLKDVWDESSGKAHFKNGKAGKPFFAVSIVREDWKRSYELITAMDAWAGEKIREIKEAGLYEDTIIFFWSDHGVGLPRAKRWLYDSGTHIPLVVRIPRKLRTSGQGKPGTIDDQLISTIDFGPTVLNLAGVKIAEHMQGRPFLGRNLPPQRDYVYGARDRMDERYDIIRSVRDKRYRYIRNYEPLKTFYQYMNTPEKGATMKEIRRVHAEGKLPPAAKLFMAERKSVEELYDLESDPHEINNLAGKAKYRPLLEKMRKVHLQWVQDTRDLGLIPEPEIMDREAKYGNRYAILRQPGDEELNKRLGATAAMASEGKDALGKLTEAMKDSDAAVRYWGATGIGNIGADAISAESLMERALDDESVSVRVAAARALCKMDKPQKALPVLIETLDCKHEWGRLQAAIVLDYIGEAAKPAEDALKKCMTRQPNKYITRVANRALNDLNGTNNTVR